MHKLYADDEKFEMAEKLDTKRLDKTNSYAILSAVTINI